MTLLPTSLGEFFPVTYKAQSPPLPVDLILREVLVVWGSSIIKVGLGWGCVHNDPGLAVTKGNSPIIPAHRRGLLSEVMCACEHLSSERRLAVELPPTGLPSRSSNSFFFPILCFHILWGLFLKKLFIEHWNMLLSPHALSVLAFNKFRPLESVRSYHPFITMLRLNMWGWGQK